MANNPLVSDRNVEFLLYEVFDAEGLCELPIVRGALARDVRPGPPERAQVRARGALPTYKPMDEAPAHRVGEGIEAHPAMQVLYPKLVEQGLTAATRPYEVGGQQLPHDGRDALRPLRDGREPAARSATSGLTTRRRAPHRGVRQRRAQGRDDDAACTAASGPARWRSPSRRRAAA